jgi:hypothetical protein
VTELFRPARERLDALKTGRGSPTIDEELMANLRDPAAIKEHLDRLQRSAYDDPALAIGTAKELVESTAKVVLAERGLPVSNRADLPALVSKSPDDLLGPDHPAAGPEIDEGIDEIRAVHPGDLDRMISGGELDDAYTLAAITCARARTLLT